MADWHRHRSAPVATASGPNYHESCRRPLLPCSPHAQEAWCLASSLGLQSLPPSRPVEVRPVPPLLLLLASMPKRQLAHSAQTFVLQTCPVLVVPRRLRSRYGAGFPGRSSGSCCLRPWSQLSPRFFCRHGCYWRQHCHPSQARSRYRYSRENS